MKTPVDTSPDSWWHYAILDPLDHRAVLHLIRARAHLPTQEYVAGVGWRPRPKLAKKLQGKYALPLRQLTDDQLHDILDQIGPPHPGPPATPQDGAGALAHAFRRARGSDRSGTIGFGHVYVQWLDVEAHVQVEVVSNAYLPEHDRLALEDQLRIAQAGMVPPDLNGPNWSWAIRSPEGFHLAACAVVGALGVYGITPDEIVGALGR